MTSSEIRQSFLDFFKSKGHTLVPSSSLMPDAPNLLFTNAGMNQFVPIFLGQRAADVDRWPGAVPGSPTRAADTQKCIRAGGKHNDLEDVGLDTYHHTFFEMLGNWSFGDYFKKEAIEWAWELVAGIWRFPKNRLYATVYKPGPGDPSEFDQEAYDHWAGIFSAAGLDPKVHIQFGGKKDNFWMMGETGPCGPCSEIHVDLTPQGDTRGALVNKGSAECIEIWNLVFIQFNANPDGTFSALPARHVDTGMGFERVTSIMQNTRGFTDFTRVISNYETDIFRPLFDTLEELSGKRYGSTLPPAGATAQSEQEKVDIAFRVIADHIRTLSFAIADGILPGNNDRNYVLRRILRRAVRYGRTLGFHEPFFYKLVGILAQTMGNVFPEIRQKQKQVEEIIKTEEEAFNRTLDRGIELFETEIARLLSSSDMGSAPAPGAVVGAPPTTSGATYSKRHLPHFERPWAKYMVTFSTDQHRQLTPSERDLVLESILYGHNHHQYQLFAASVMPDHVHLLFEPQIKEQDKEGRPIFWSLSEILQGIKSTTAHRINRTAGTKGQHVWSEESFDRLVRGDRDFEEKFHYICRNPWDAGVVPLTESYKWLWTPEFTGDRGTPESGRAEGRSREGAGTSARGGRAPHTEVQTREIPEAQTREITEAQRREISGAFAFRLYDEQGFPLDLTELMARERGLTVDKAGFDKLMAEQKARARAAQKREVISVSQVQVEIPTRFVGYEQLEAKAKVLESVSIKDKTAVVLDTTPLYAEMGGQVGDTGELAGAGQLWRVANTQKAGDAFLHFLGEQDGPESALAPGVEVEVSVDRARRAAIQRHHTVTHLLHWALHEVVSREAAQKGSYVGPEKLTFDFNSAALTPAQVADIERLVNERIVENAGVSWTEVPYREIKPRKDVMQFFGEKYGDVVRVVQIGGKTGELNGYSMELCGGTHSRATGEIGLFRIVGESAIAAGVRRIEAVAGLEAYQKTKVQAELLEQIAGKVNAPVGEVERKIESLLAQQKELEKQLKALQQKEAANSARKLMAAAATVHGIPVILENMGPVDSEILLGMVNELKGQFKGVILLGGSGNNAATLIASVSPEFTSRVQAGKLIQQIAPIVGGKGGGKPDSARGGGKDTTRLDEALAKAREMLEKA